MGLNVKTADGKEGYFDTAAFLNDAAPGASITDYNKQDGIVKFKTQDGKDGEFNVKQMLADQGTSVTGHGDFNTPVGAADVSPLTWKERLEMGYLTRESSDFQRLITGVSAMFGNKPSEEDKQKSDQAFIANEKRALKILKSRYEDATIANGEMVIKQNGVWKKVDSSSDSIGADAAQLLGSTGLNIMGAIAGGAMGATYGAAAGPVGAVVGGTVGAVGGSMAGEVAEEATAVGLAGGQVDFHQAATDIATEGVMAMAGEIAGAGISKMINKVIGKSAVTTIGSKEFSRGAGDLAAGEAVQRAGEGLQASVNKGFKVVAQTADSKVKDGLASMYSNINPSLSREPLREALDSAENMTKAQAYSKLSKLVYEDGARGEEKLTRSMADELQTGLDNAFSVAQDKFGAVVKKIRNSVNSDFTVDLEQHLTDLKAAAQEAPRDKRAFFDSLQNETSDLIAKLRGEGSVQLEGKKAFDFVQRQYELINTKLKTLGAYDAQKLAGPEDRLLFNSMEKTRSYLDSARTFAAEHAGLSEELDAVKKMYGGVKDALDTVWSKAYSNKRDLTFAQNVAKGTVDQNVKEAINTVNRLVPEANVKNVVSSMRLKQAGIEMAPTWSKSPEAFSSIPGAVKTAASAALGSLNPKIAAGQARMAAAASEGMTKNALAQAMPAARQQARALLGMAHSAGFLRAAGNVEARKLLLNPDAFNAYMQKSEALTNSLMGMDENKVLDSAIQKQQIMQEQKVGGK